jgi:hypothetical protein
VSDRHTYIHTCTHALTYINPLNPYAENKLYYLKTKNLYIDSHF